MPRESSGAAPQRFSEHHPSPPRNGTPDANGNSGIDPYHGLSDEVAISRLLDSANSMLDDHRRQIRSTISLVPFLKRLDTILTMFLAIALIANFCYSCALAQPVQRRQVASLPEACIMLLVLAWNAWLYLKEWRLTQLEVTSRIQSIVNLASANKQNLKLDCKIPTTLPTISMARVIRNDQIRHYPSTLLVEGDVVVLSYGDRAPCDVKYIGTPTLSAKEHVNDSDHQSGTSATGYISDGGSQFVNVSNTNVNTLTLSKNTLFKPSLFDSVESSGLRNALKGKTEHRFVLLETPLKHTLTVALHPSRPDTVLVIQLRLIFAFISNRVIPLVFLVSLVVNTIRFGVKVANDPSRLTQGVEMLLVEQVLALLPLLSLSVPTWILVARSYANAQVVALLEALQSSKVEFEDEDDIDEFDAAPPPTKDITPDWRSVWTKFINQLGKMDIEFLARTTGLVESLANTTVICSIDRDGTISMPLPSVEQIFLLGENGEPVILDVAEDAISPSGVKFEDRDWQANLPSLGPLGLSLMLTADCGVLQGRKRNEIHRKFHRAELTGHISACQQTCCCRIAREIGFTPEVAASYQLHRRVQTIAPRQADDNMGDYYFEVPNLFSGIFEKDVGSGMFQVMSEGNVDLIMDSCGDYWTGQTLMPLTESIERKISEFYQNATISALHVIGYSYRPIPFPIPSFPFTSPEPYRIELLSASETPESDSSSPTNPAEDGNLSAAASNGPRPATSTPTPSQLAQQLPKLKRRRTKGRILSMVDSVDEGGELPDWTEETFFQEVVKAQTFLGMISMTYQPKRNVVDFIEDLGFAGIRYVYFSPSPERESKAYAERLGLEIDWNACILLSSEESGSHGYLEDHDIKAQLPRGIENMRQHIDNVDDIPLHVSLFAECSEPRSVAEMIRIFQEYGDVVCCIGSSMNQMNVESFAWADISVAVDPLSTLKTRSSFSGIPNHHKHTRSNTYPYTVSIPLTNTASPSSSPAHTPLTIAALFNTTPCAINLNFDTSLYSVTQIIREARTLSTNGRQAFSFIVGCHFSLSLICLLSYCMLLPPILTPYQVMWMQWVILPPIAGSFLFTPRDPDIMTLMPLKNQDHLKDIWRFVSYFFARFVLPAIMCVILFMLTLMYSLPSPPQADSAPIAANIFGNGIPSWMSLSENDQWALLHAQHSTMIAFIVYMGGYLDAKEGAILTFTD
ncbi:hypothetical protein BJ742DRAFT_803098 [Cladochytrium replicatum]|nr:hypothetical protein BJ742DRAFT_803098 [Cladochytrium replicatum]